MEKFTKGDWVPCIRNDDQLQTTFFGVVMNRVYLQIGSGNENRMNANLIAAAPEMYNEIVSDISWLEQMKSKFVVGSYEFRSICLRIESKQKLLAKARGEL